MRVQLFRLSALLLLLAILFAPGCKKAPPSEFAPDVLAVVNGSAITVDDFLRAFAQARAGKSDPLPDDPMNALQVKAVFLSELVENKLLAQQAVAHAITVGDADIDKAVAALAANYPGEEFDRMLASKGMDRNGLRAELAQKALLEKISEKIVLPSVKVQPSEIEAEYKLRAGRYREPEKIRASQILVDSESEAQNIVTELYGGADFAEIARARSKAPEVKSGGDLGYFAMGEMPESVTKVAFNTPVGQLTGVVQSPFGYHILRVTDRRPEHVVPLETVSKQIEADLRAKKSEQALEEYLQKLKDSSDIRYNQTLIMKLELKKRPAE